jgi:hypothetical protein
MLGRPYPVAGVRRALWLSLRSTQSYPESGIQLYREHT